MLDPIVDRRNCIERIRARTAAAMLHAGHHEQAQELIRRRLSG